MTRSSRSNGPTSSSAPSSRDTGGASMIATRRPRSIPSTGRTWFGTVGRPSRDEVVVATAAEALKAGDRTAVHSRRDRGPASHGRDPGHGTGGTWRLGGHTGRQERAGVYRKHRGATGRGWEPAIQMAVRQDCRVSLSLGANAGGWSPTGWWWPTPRFSLRALRGLRWMRRCCSFSRRICHCGSGRG